MTTQILLRNIETQWQQIAEAFTPTKPKLTIHK